MDNGNKRVHPFLRLLAVCLAVMLCFSACGSGGNGEGSGDSGDGAGGGTGSAGDEVVVGALYPLSGNQATTGTEIRSGVELALDIVNNAYPDINLPLAAEEGIPSLGGAKLKIIYGDTQAIPEKGMSVAEQVLTSDNAVAIIGCYNSAVGATIAQVTERLEKVFLCPDCTSPTLTQNGFEWFFRLTPDDHMFTSNMITFMNEMNEEKGADLKTVAIVNENSLWGQDFADLATQLLEENGYEVVLNLVYAANSAELNSEVQKIKQVDPDVIMHSSYASDAILFLKTYKEQGYAPKLLLANGGGFTESAFTESLGSDSDYAINRSVYAQDIGESKPIVKVINDLYKERNGRDMNEYSSRGFMGVIVLADAINRAGSTESEAIRKALLETNIPAEQIILAWEGIQFDPETGQNVLGKALMGQLKDGVVHTIWPFDLAPMEVVYPAPEWSER